MKVSTAPTMVCSRFSPMIGVANASTRRCVIGFGASVSECGVISEKSSGAACASAASGASSIVVSTRPQAPEQDRSGGRQDTRGGTRAHDAALDRTDSRIRSELEI